MRVFIRPPGGSCKGKARTRGFGRYRPACGGSANQAQAATAAGAAAALRDELDAPELEGGPAQDRVARVAGVPVVLLDARRRGSGRRPHRPRAGTVTVASPEAGTRKEPRDVTRRWPSQQPDLVEAAGARGREPVTLQAQPVSPPDRRARRAARGRGLAGRAVASAIGAPGAGEPPASTRRRRRPHAERARATTAAAAASQGLRETRRRAGATGVAGSGGSTGSGGTSPGSHASTGSASRPATSGRSRSTSARKSSVLGDPRLDPAPLVGRELVQQVVDRSRRRRLTRPPPSGPSAVAGRAPCRS